MENKKIVLIGSGSQFTEFFLQEIYKYPELKGLTVALVDRRPERLGVVKGICEKLDSMLDFGVKYEGYTDRRDALPGADLVFSFIAVDLKEAWNNDGLFCRRHGLNPYEFHTSSIGSLSMGMRHIPPHMDICKDIEELCPDAWFIIESNPLTKILSAILRHTKVKAVGYCYGHEMIQVAIEQILALDENKETLEVESFEREFMIAGDTVSVLAMGVNHMGWVMTMRDTETGEDLYPAFREKCKITPIEKIPLGYRYSVELCNRLGYIPLPADVHVADYIWNADETIAKKTNLIPFDPYESFGGRGPDSWGEFAKELEDIESINKFISLRKNGWQSVKLMCMMLGGKYEYFPAVNIMNNGCISNMSDDVVVEVPGVVGPDYVGGLNMGKLPEELQPYCELHGIQGNLIADAAAFGDKSKAIKAMLMDPFLASITKADAMVDEVIEINRKYDISFK